MNEKTAPGAASKDRLGGGSTTILRPASDAPGPAHRITIAVELDLRDDGWTTCATDLNHRARLAVDGIRAGDTVKLTVNHRSPTLDLTLPPGVRLQISADSAHTAHRWAHLLGGDQ